MRFSGQRLRDAGYRFKFGMARAEELALARLALERRADGHEKTVHQGSPV
jgi:hypothetical protein